MHLCSSTLLKFRTFQCSPLYSATNGLSGQPGSHILTSSGTAQLQTLSLNLQSIPIKLSETWNPSSCGFTWNQLPTPSLHSSGKGKEMPQHTKYFSKNLLSSSSLCQILNPVQMWWVKVYKTCLIFLSISSIGGLVLLVSAKTPLWEGKSYLTSCNPNYPHPETVLFKVKHSRGVMIIKILLQ